jgi:hypothetical protein
LIFHSFFLFSLFVCFVFFYKLSTCTDIIDNFNTDNY